MLMQVAPRNARPRNPENPIQNNTMVPRATTTARAALNHEWFKAGPFLVAHQTPEHDKHLVPITIALINLFIIKSVFSHFEN